MRPSHRGHVHYGAYSVMVNTEVCGTFNSGSNPDRHPAKKSRASGFFAGWVSKATACLAFGI